MDVLLEQGANFAVPHTHTELAPLRLAKQGHNPEIALSIENHMTRLAVNFSSAEEHIYLTFVTYHFQFGNFL